MALLHKGFTGRVATSSHTTSVQAVVIPIKHRSHEYCCTYTYSIRQQLTQARQRFRLRATRQDLAPLGLSDPDICKLEEIILSTGATDISPAVQALTTFSGSASAARALVLRNPHLLCCQLPSWVEFFTSFGLNKAQVQHVLCQTPEALIQGDLVRAGESILTFRRLGMDTTAAAQLVTYYPQLLGKDEKEIRSVLALLGRYQSGIESHSC